MAQASIAVTPGSGPAVDFRTVGATPYYRQMIGIGDPTTDTAVAPVTAANGLLADVSRIVAALPTGTNLIGNTSTGQRSDIVYGPAGATYTSRFATLAAAASGNNTVVLAVTSPSSKKIRVTAAYLIANGTVNAKWQSGASGTDLTGLAYLVANAGYVLPFNPLGWFESGSGVLLNLNLSAAVAVGGAVQYVEV